MLALVVHPDKKPVLAKGSMVVPLARWEDSKIPLRILREEAKNAGRAPDHFVTLVKLPDTQTVAIVIGNPRVESKQLQFAQLRNISAEDRELIEKSFANFRNPPQAELGPTWLARLVLGEKLAEGCVKWTKDFRLLQQGARNATTKRT